MAQAHSTLVASRVTSAEDRAIVGHLLEAAGHIETLYAMQRGVHGLAAQIPADDAASRMMFFRNQGPWCVAPATESNPDCNALSSFPPKISGLYPATLQKDEKFCEALARPPHDKALLSDHFSRVVTGDSGKLEIEPYPKAYAAPMAAVAASLRAAAGAIQSEREAAFARRLFAAVSP